MILVTGASGFLGSRLCKALSYSNVHFRGVTSQNNIRSDPKLGKLFKIPAFHKKIDWSAALAEIDCIIHCAAKAHVVDKRNDNSLELFRAVNVGVSQQLAEQAASSGVRRFIYLSSIGVLGNNTDDRDPFCESDLPNPVGNYATSKWEAEKVLQEIAAKTGLELVIIRPPLIYGPNPKGSMKKLLTLVRLNLPLPLGALKNKRSFIGIDNLVDLLIHCTKHPKAEGQTFLVSDGNDLSTKELIIHITNVLDTNPYLFNIPTWMLHALGAVAGKREEIKRLTSSLQINNDHVCECLNWNPPLTVLDGIHCMAKEI